MDHNDDPAAPADRDAPIGAHGTFDATVRAVGVVIVVVIAFAWLLAYAG